MKPSTEQAIRHALIAARKKKGMTQQELANAVGISRSFLANLELGKYAPSLQVARDIADELESTIEILFC